MQFLFPNILYGLFAVSIPVIIHLLNFQKYKKVYFTQTELVADLKQQTKRQSTLRHWIILLMRMLAVGMLVLAFANPFIAGHDKASGIAERYISVYLDNSFSMQAEQAEGSLLNEGKNKAISLTEAYGPSAKYQLITNELQGKQQRWLTAEQFVSEVEEVSFSPDFRLLSEVVTRQQQMIREDDIVSSSIYSISDFQKTVYDPENIALDTGISWHFVPVKAYNTTNAWIDSVWFNSPALFAGQNARLNIRMKKTGDLESVPLKLFVNQRQRVAVNVEFSEQTEKTISVSLNINETGHHQCRLELSDNSVDFDNTFYFTFNVPELVKVLVVNEAGTESRYLQSFFRNDSLVMADFSSIQTLDYQAMASYSAVILDQMEEIPSGLTTVLDKFVKSGKSLIIFPSMNSDVSSYNDLLVSMDNIRLGAKDNNKKQVSSIVFESDFFEGFFLDKPKNPDYPVIFESYNISYGLDSRAEALIRQSDGNPFLLRSRSGKGNVFLFSVASNPESSTFVTHHIFPVIYKMIFEGAISNRLYFTLGENEIYNNSSIDVQGETVPVLESFPGEAQVIPALLNTSDGISFLAADRMSESGIWELKYDDKSLDYLAYNYSGRESDTRLAEISENLPEDIKLLDNTASGMYSDIRMAQHGIQLWPWFLIGALIFLLIEVILLRIWKL